MFKTSKVITFKDFQKKFSLNGFELFDGLNDFWSEELANNLQAVPLKKDTSFLYVGMLEPENFMAKDNLQSLTGLKIEPVLCSEEEFRLLILQVYSVKKIMDLGNLPEHNYHNTYETEETTIIKMVDYIFIQAIVKNGSDIHFEPRSEKLKIRFRIDGVLVEFMELPLAIYPKITTRLKVISNLDISERRLPADGRFKFLYQQEQFDMRLSIIPTVYGEKIGIRILNNTTLLNLSELGLEKIVLKNYQRLINLSSGILLIAGPTGSGKTTTLYSTIAQINNLEKNIITIEDPVEYVFPDINQVPVNKKIGLDFSLGLRAILRQDPDIIIVGEIRDKETAEIAIQAAMTGHLVLSTIHTGDAAGTIVRLLDMGIEPYQLASALMGVLAQRLIRKKCSACDSELNYCPNCNNVGFKGRIGIFEMLEINDELRSLIMAKSAVEAFRAYMLKQGIGNLWQDGIKKLELGITTKEELSRVVSNYN